MIICRKNGNCNKLQYIVIIALIMELKTVYQNYMCVIFNQQFYMFTQFIYTCIKKHNKAGFGGFRTYDLFVLLLDFFFQIRKCPYKLINSSIIM